MIRYTFFTLVNIEIGDKALGAAGAKTNGTCNRQKNVLQEFVEKSFRALLFFFKILHVYDVAQDVAKFGSNLDKFLSAS